MHIRSHRLLALTASVALAGTIAACGEDGGGGSGDQPVVACIVKTLQSPFFQATQRGCEDTAKAENAKLLFATAETEADINGQIAKVEDALAKGAEAIVIAPNAPDQLQPVLDRAAKDDVPVLLLDTDIPKMKDKTAYIGTDNVKAGALGAKHILDNGGKGKFGIITGSPGITSVEQRVSGAKKVFKGSPVEVVQTLNARDCTRDAGVNVTEDLLTAHPDLDGIFYVCDQPMLGGVEAIKKANKKPEDLFILGFDAEPEAVDLVKKGVVDGDVAQFPEKMGVLGVQNAIKALDEKSVPKTINSGAEVVTKENASASRFK